MSKSIHVACVIVLVVLAVAFSISTLLGAPGRPGPPPAAPVSCLGARGKQAQLAEANGSKFNMLLILVAQMSTHPRAIAACYCCWGSTKFKPTHGAPTAFEDLGVQPRRPCSPWTLRLTTFVVVISSWDLMVTSTGSRACESKPHKVRNVSASKHSGDDSPAWGSCEFPGGVNSPPRVLPSTNNGLVSTRGARRALLPHLIAHSGAGFAFSQKEDFRRSMSSWLARAADLLARVAMNRLRLAFCSRASDLAIYGGLTLDAYCGRRRRVYLRALFLAYRRGYFFG